MVSQHPASRLPRVVPKAPPWHGWVTGDLFLLSAASGTFTIASICITMRPALEPVARPALLLVLPLMLADLACLIVDLGDPLRFYHMLRVFKPGSPMLIAVWSISIFSFILFLVFVATIFDLPPGLIRGVAIAGLPFAIVIGGYKGVLFSTTAQPGWRRMRWLGAAFAVSSLAIGASILLAISAMRGTADTTRALRIILMSLLVLNAIAVRLVMGRVGADGHLSEPLNRALLFGTSMRYLGFMVLGLGAPIVTCALANAEPRFDFATLILVLAGAVASRHYLVIIPPRWTPHDSTLPV